MRYAKGHKDETRKRILDIAGQRFRRDGIDAVGVVPLMKEAGLTHGGFYAHFASKDALVAETVGSAFGQTNARLARAVARAPSGKGLEALLDTYLAPAHRDAPGNGCLAAALAGELSRATDDARAAFQQGLDELVALIEAQLDGSFASDERRRRALGIASTMVGALTLSRTTSGSPASDLILKAGRDAALAMARA